MKKIMILLLVILLTASAAIGVTLAYLTDSDEDVNVMTVGNIFIEQHEKERDEQGNFVDYEDNKPFYPAVYPGDFDFNTPTVELPGTSCKLWDASLIENANDKIVTVTNTGASDCYVRTWFAFEDSGSNVYYNTNTADWSWSSIMQDVTIAGTVYDLYAATYPTALKPGQTTPPSLLQYALSRYVLNAGGGSPITVRGGTFVNHRPGVDQDPGTIRVAEGYKTISQVREDGNTYYTVVPEE